MTIKNTIVKINVFLNFFVLFLDNLINRFKKHIVVYREKEISTKFDRTGLTQSTHENIEDQNLVHCINTRIKLMHALFFSHSMFFFFLSNNWHRLPKIQIKRELSLSLSLSLTKQKDKTC
jgi:hypothetical protein